MAQAFFLYLLFAGLLKGSVVLAGYFTLSQRNQTRLNKVIISVGGLLDIFAVCFLWIHVVSLNSSLPFVLSGFMYSDVQFLFLLNPIDLAYLAFAFVLLGLVGRFSEFYIHKDPHYSKFFGLFYLFQTATVFLILADNFTSYFAGWELLGVSSALLISFYNERISPVKNSIRIFGLYKIADFLLFAGFAFVYSMTHLQSFSEFTSVNVEVFSIYVLLCSIAIAIKMGTFPIPWLPRAMEGPTPSSAVFYGALATHVPLLLFIKLWAGTDVSSWVKGVMTVIFLASIFISTLLSKIQPDAKNALAYATTKHLALIAIEVMYGFVYLAYFHIVLHCFYRIFQFIRTPSLLYEKHQSEGYHGEEFPSVAAFSRFNVSHQFQKQFYRFIIRKLRITPRIFELLDILVGLSPHPSFRKVKLVFVVNMMLAIALVMLSFLDDRTAGVNFLLLVPCWIFAIYGLIVDYHDWRNMDVEILSVLSLLTTVFHFVGQSSLQSVILTQVALFVLLLVTLKLPELGMGTAIRSERIHVILFIIMLWVVGVPGPGSYLFFEHIIHQAIQKDVVFAVSVFLILSVNTLSVLKNFGINSISLQGSRV